MSGPNSEAAELCDEFADAWGSDPMLTVEVFLDRLRRRVDTSLLRKLLEVELELRFRSAAASLIRETTDQGDDGPEADTLSVALQSVPFSNASYPSSTADTSDTKVPETVGRYQVNDVLGGGGFGVVYRAWDPLLERDVAIKMLRERRANDPAALKNEALILSQLDHPHIVPVLDFGWSPDGTPFLVSKFIPSKDLRQILSEEQLSYSRAAAICSVLARALHHAHKRSIIHRDVKPANILVEPSGHVWLADFGLGASTSDTEWSCEHGGTPAYMSPEQVAGLGSAIDGRSDIFSLGIVLYEMLTGAHPFDAESSQAVREKILRHNAQSCRLVRDSVPRQLDEACIKALARDLTARYTVATDFAQDLETAAMYQPKPLDVSQIALPDGLGQLIEVLAKNTHDVWAQRRIAEGWQLGDARNDEQKIHPDLVPYDELSDGEKQYDRATVENTLKAIVLAGYAIHCPDHS